MNVVRKDSIFKYKGEKYILTESVANNFTGIRYKLKGINCLIVSANLPYNKKMLVIHKLISNKNLKIMSKEVIQKIISKIENIL